MASGKKQKEEEHAEKQEKKFSTAKTEKKPEKRDRPRNLAGIVRLGNIDIDGSLPLIRALWHIRGIGINTATLLGKAASQNLGVPQSTTIGALDDKQRELLEDMIVNPSRHGLPEYVLNRRRERETGESRHLIGNDLIFAVKQDIDFERDSYSWRGFRHAFGQKVRGQHTRTTGRRGLAVGVIRKGLKPTAAAAGPGAPGAPGAPAAPGAAVPKGGSVPKAPGGAAAPATAAGAAKPEAKPAEKKPAAPAAKK